MSNATINATIRVVNYFVFFTCAPVVLKKTCCDFTTASFGLTLISDITVYISAVQIVGGKIICFYCSKHRLGVTSTFCISKLITCIFLSVKERILSLAFCSLAFCFLSRCFSCSFIFFPCPLGIFFHTSHRMYKHLFLDDGNQC